jgi:hypothetical protein
MPGWAFLNETDSLNPSLVARVVAPDLIEQSPIDLEDDLQVAWQHLLKPLYRPPLEGFGQ